MDKHEKIIITGVAGLLGQNTILLLREQGYSNILAIDKHSENLQTLKKLNPDIEILEADLSQHGIWEKYFADGSILLQLYAQITSLYLDEFEQNNINETQNVLRAARKFGISYIVHISSSVVISVADDFYTNTKKAQEKLVDECSIPNCSLRPTLMFG